jgi:enoyl-CoA hydratase
MFLLKRPGTGHSLPANFNRRQGRLQNLQIAAAALLKANVIVSRAMRIERKGDVALLRLEAGKANAIGPAFLSAISDLFEGLRDARAAVITGQGAAFSAGLDLPALIDLDRGALRAFMDRFDEVMLRLFELPQPLVAAVNGHAIAGGCVLALQADLRIAADRELRIGLNETQLGIGLPAIVVETLRCQVPPQSLPVIALEGRLFSPREALQLGLVHEVVPEAELLDRALQRATALAALPEGGARLVKAALRQPAAELVRARRAAEAEQWLESWFSVGAQEKLRAAVDRLKRR